MMTTLKKELAHTILRVERVDPKDSASLGPDDHNGRHVAGGQHQGIIINKQLGSSVSALNSRAFDLRLAFKVYLINAITSIHQQESRELRFWFSTEDEVLEEYGYSDRMHCAQAFFRALVGGGSDGFPKSYVAFIMKLMKTMQSAEFRPLRQLELEVRAVDEPFERPPSSAANSRPCKYHQLSLERSTSLQQENISTLPELPDVVVQTNKVGSGGKGRGSRGPPPPVPPKPKNLQNLQKLQFPLSTSKSLGLECCCSFSASRFGQSLPTKALLFGFVPSLYSQLDDPIGVQTTPKTKRQI